MCACCVTGQPIVWGLVEVAAAAELVLSVVPSSILIHPRWQQDTPSRFSKLIRMTRETKGSLSVSCQISYINIKKIALIWKEVEGMHDKSHVRTSSCRSCCSIMLIIEVKVLFWFFRLIIYYFWASMCCCKKGEVTTIVITPLTNEMHLYEIIWVC